MNINTKQIPVYKKFQQEVRQKILDGVWTPGGQLPSERDLQGMYDISRLTIRKSLNRLVEEGLLVRYQGKGTFVAGINVASPQFQADANIDSQLITVKYLAPGRNGSPASPIRLGVCEGVHQLLDPLGYVSAVDFFNNLEQYENAVRRLPETCSAAVIWNEPYINPGVFEYLQRRKFPFVLLDSYPTGIELDYVVGDNLFGGRLVVEHLVSLGHSKIVYVTTPICRTSLRDRQAGFIQAAIQAGIEFNNASIVTLGGDNEDVWKENVSGAIDEILNRQNRPTAICMSNDILALKAIQYLGEKGIDVPNEMSIVGYDNIDLGEFSAVPLTTVGQHWMEIGRSAADVISQKLQDKKPRRPLQIMVKPTFIKRKSTSKPLLCP